MNSRQGQSDNELSRSKARALRARAFHPLCAIATES